jgi:hypothetical protein
VIEEGKYNTDSDDEHVIEEGKYKKPVELLI